jgi:predicted RNase H-like HicB family nuclease
MSRYIALAHRGETGFWGISFPDFPGCISAADSFEDVVERGAEALRFHVEGLLEDGETIAEPRSLEDLQADPEFAEDFDKAIVTVVPLLPPRDRPMRVNVILDANLLANIDTLAKQLGLNRSEFLAEGARRLIVSPEKVRRAAGTELSEFAASTSGQYEVHRVRTAGMPIHQAGREAASGRFVPVKKARTKEGPRGKRRG